MEPVVIASFLQVVVLIWYTVVTQRMVSVAKNSHDAQMNAFVSVRVEMPPGSGSLYLVIENLGRMIAREVSISFDPQLDNDANPGTSIPYLSRPIPALAPGQRLSTAFAICISALNKPEYPKVYAVQVRWKQDATSRQFAADTHLDITEIGLTIDPEGNSRNDLTNEVRDLRKEVRRIADHFNSS